MPKKRHISRNICQIGIISNNIYFLSKYINLNNCDIVQLLYLSKRPMTIFVTLTTKGNVSSVLKFRFAMLNPGMRIRIRSHPFIFGPPDPVLFYWIRIKILPVTTDLKNYFHLEQNLNQNQQFQA